jgi:hypothetical protein
MHQRNQHTQHIKTHASKRLRFNLRMLFVVCIVLLLVTLYNVIVSGAALTHVIIALIIGFVAGFMSARIYKISWNKDQAKVVGRIDAYGVIVLIVFAIFELNRTFIANLFSGGEALGAIGFVLLTSALFGRIVGTSSRILKVLSEEKII